MKPDPQKLKLLAACILCAALGWGVAMRQAHTGIFSPSTGDIVNVSGAHAGSDAGDTAGPRRPHGTLAATASVAMPLSADTLRRRLLAGVSTEQLWEWLRSDTEPQHSLLPLGEPTGEPLLDELVDRLGWQAWQQLVAGDTEWYNRNRCEYVLTLLARKDPWQAYTVWRDLHDFYGPTWAQSIPIVVLNSAEPVSAANLLEVVKVMRERNISYSGDLVFGPDFDFRTAADGLIAREDSFPDQRFVLLNRWAERAPLEAAQWLADHPEAMERDGKVVDLNPEGVIQAVAELPADTPGRREALEILGRLPEVFLKTSWESRWGQSPVYSPAMAAAAEAMGQEKNYLTLLIYQTSEADEIDPSWGLLSAADREYLLNQAEIHMTARDQLRPVDLRLREDWRQAVLHAGERGR